MRSAPRILLVCPPTAPVYRQAAVREGVPHAPPLSLATLAAAVRARGMDARVLDLGLHGSPLERTRQAAASLSPDWVGVTVVTPLWDLCRQTVQAARQGAPGARVVLGGPHVSALPEEALAESGADAVIFGEGDEALPELMAADEPSPLPGVGVRGPGGRVSLGPPRELIEDLDTLPMPAWELFTPARYVSSHLLSRRSPAGWIETSRGCPHGCIYCSKQSFGQGFRAKSPERVVDEMARMLRLGFREVHIADDCFTADPERAAAICEQILARGLRFPWAPVIGLRVDTLTPDLLRLMRRSGCYRIYLGVESGSDRLLDAVQKGIALDDVRRAVSDSRRAGLETFGFFMIALPGETETTMAATRRFAVELGLDLAKISVTIPLPGTPLFRRLEQEGRLLSRRWSDYRYHHPPRAIYRHENLTWDQVERNLRGFYRAFYFRPRFMVRRLAHAMRSGTLLADFQALLRTDW